MRPGGCQGRDILDTAAPAAGEGWTGPVGRGRRPLRLLGGVSLTGQEDARGTQYFLRSSSPWPGGPPRRCEAGFPVAAVGD